MIFLAYFKEIWRGKDLNRIFMNEECRNYSIYGKTIDVGSGLKLASYHRFLKREQNATVEFLDLGFEAGQEGKKINLEKDHFPQPSVSIDTILLFNILEHIYNYQLVLSEIKRVLKPNGQLLGAAPFLIAYHPDPHDYWRYTREALEKIFTAAGFTNIEIKAFGYGPVSAAFSQMETVIPKILKIILVPGILFADWFIIKLRPKLNKEKFSLGLFFRVS